MKKLIATVLALILVLVPLSTLCIASAETESVPDISVHGMFASTLCENPADPDSDTIWPPDAAKIINSVKGDLPTYIKGLCSSDTSTVVSTVGSLVNALLGDIMLNSDGETGNTSGVRFEYPDPSEITADSQLKFVYDWRLDPSVLAAQLNDFINYVLECSGCSQVTIRCHSYGSIVTTTYFTLYGHDKVKTVVYNAAALYGETYTGELMLGEFVLDADAIENYLEFAFDYSESRDLLNWLAELLNKYNVLDKIADSVNSTVENAQRELYKQAILPIFAMCPSIWAMVPDSMIEDAEAYIFDDIYEGDTKYDALREKIDSYNETVRAVREDTLKAVNEDVNLYVISKYGYSSIPVSPSSNNLSDGVVDVKYSSFGATAGQYGVPLSASQVADTPAEYLEPMLYIDASTCLFPGQTFFISNMRHGGTNEALTQMIDTLIAYDGQATVDTFPQYSRFMYYNGVTGTLTATAQSYTSFFGRILEFFRKMNALFTTMFSKLKGC